jgi:hypothetical protein
MINLIFYSIRIMGNTNQKPLTQADVKRMIADGLDQYTTGCAKVMAATLVRADGTTQELICTGRARTFWLLFFGIASSLIYASLLFVGIMGSTGAWNIKRDGKPAPGEDFFIYCGVGFFLSVLTVLWSAFDILGESWGSSVYGEKTLFAKMNAYIKWGEEKKKKADKSISYEAFQPCNTRRTPTDCTASSYTEVVLPRNKTDYLNLPKEFTDRHDFVPGSTNGITVKNSEGVLFEHKLMYVERQCMPSGKDIKVFKCDIDSNVNTLLKANKVDTGGTTILKDKDGNIKRYGDKKGNEAKRGIVMRSSKDNEGVLKNNEGKVLKDDEGKVLKKSKGRVAEDNLTEFYNKNLKLLPCNRRQDKNVCENLKESGDGIVDKDCGWLEDKKICKKKWKPLTGADIWGCDECDDLSELCTLSDRTMYGAIVFIVCGIIMIIAGVELDTMDEESDDSKWHWLQLTCYIGGTVILLVGFIYTALSIMCPAGSDMFGQGVQDGGFYQTLWWISTFGGRLQ